MANVTIIETIENRPLAVGQVFQLKAVNNPADPNAVAVVSGDEQYGWVANSSNTVIGGTLTAAQTRQRWLENSKCAGVSVILRKEGSYINVVGKQQKRFLAEVFVIPAREEKNGLDEDKHTYEVGGLTAKNPQKVKVFDAIQQREAGALSEIRVVVVKHGDKVHVCFADNTAAGASAGEVTNPDPELLEALEKNKGIAAVVLNGSGKGMTYQIEVDVNGKNAVGSISDYYELIDRTVGRCVAQSPSLEKRVSHMMESGFEREMVETVLDQMPVLNGERMQIPKPAMPYWQKEGGHNLLDLTANLLDGRTVSLEGEKGSGKNTLVETACWLLGRPLCRVQGSSRLDVDSFYGSRTLTNGSTGFELSSMMRTLMAGGVVVIDEANTIAPDVLVALHSLTDGARSVDIPDYGYVHIADGAAIVYTLNPGYIGTGEMNEATRDRGPVLQIDQEENMADLLKRAVPDAPENKVAACVRVSDAIRKSVAESDGTLTPSAITVRGYIDALKVRFIPLHRALIQNVANKLNDAAERSAVALIIDGQVKS